MEQKLFAFWKYDLFPYILGGELTKINENGSVETKEFGKGYYFQPIMIVPLERGMEIENKLKLLQAERDKVLQILDKKCEEILKEYGLVKNENYR